MYNKIYNGDCIEGLKEIADNSLDSCITDPPYNYEFVGHNWNNEEINRRMERIQNSSTLVKHIPYGSGLAGGVRNKRWYERNRENINDYQEWTYKWSKEVYRVLKPGAYILVFNSSRTIAHIQVGLERAGFYARDIIVWRKNSGIPKGLNMAKKLEKMGVNGSQKWEGWHSCLRNEWEAIAMLQKPLLNNYIETVEKLGIGLLNTQTDNLGFQSNVLDNFRREEKEDFNIHVTIKPVSLIKFLTKLVIPLEKSRVILDPFIGSGTTAVAALELGVSYLGYEINPKYCEISQKRVDKFNKNHAIQQESLPLI